MFGSLLKTFLRLPTILIFEKNLMIRHFTVHLLFSLAVTSSPTSLLPCRQVSRSSFSFWNFPYPFLLWAFPYAGCSLWLWWTLSFCQCFTKFVCWAQCKLHFLIEIFSKATGVPVPYFTCFLFIFFVSCNST